MWISGQKNSLNDDPRYAVFSWMFFRPVIWKIALLELLLF